MQRTALDLLDGLLHELDARPGHCADAWCEAVREGFYAGTPEHSVYFYAEEEIVSLTECMEVLAEAPVFYAGRSSRHVAIFLSEAGFQTMAADCVGLCPSAEWLMKSLGPPILPAEFVAGMKLFHQTGEVPDWLDYEKLEPGMPWEDGGTDGIERH